MKPMVTVRNLVNATSDKIQGNHRVEHRSDNKRTFILYWTPICFVDDDAKTFKVDASYGTRTTSAACSAYRDVFTDKGYKEILPD